MTLPHDAQPYPGHLGQQEPLLVSCLGCGALSLARVDGDRYAQGWTLLACEGLRVAPALGHLGPVRLISLGCGAALWVDLQQPEALAWHRHALEVRAWRTWRQGVRTPPHAPGMWSPAWGPPPNRTPSEPPTEPALGDVMAVLEHLPLATYLDPAGGRHDAIVRPEPRDDRGYLLSVTLPLAESDRLRLLGALGVSLSTPGELARWSAQPTAENRGRPVATLGVRAQQGHGRGQFRPISPLPPGYAEPPCDPLAVSGGSAPVGPTATEEKP